MKNIFAGFVLAVLISLVAHPAMANSGVTVTGGGTIAEGYGKNAPKITFALNVFVDNNENATGHLEVNFHNCYVDEFDKGKFQSSAIGDFSSSLNELDGIEFTFISTRFLGKFSGEEGWSLILRLADFGEPGTAKSDTGNHSDAVRISLIDPSGTIVYDTATLGGDFPREQAWRTLLDGGDIRVHGR